MSGRRERGKRDIKWEEMGDERAHSQQHWCVEPALTSVCMLPCMGAGSQEHANKQLHNRTKHHDTWVLVSYFVGKFQDMKGGCLIVL